MKSAFSPHVVNITPVQGPDERHDLTARVRVRLHEDDEAEYLLVDEGQVHSLEPGADFSELPADVQACALARHEFVERVVFSAVISEAMPRPIADFI